MANVYNTPNDCLAPGDVRALKRLEGLADLSQAQTVFLQDYAGAGAPAPGAPGSPLSPLFAGFTDATVAVVPGVGLRLNPAPQPYAITVDQAGVLQPAGFPTGIPLLDQVKYLMYTAPVAAPADGRELGVMATMAGAQTFANPKFPAAFLPYVQNVNRDWRLCALGLNCLDPDNFNAFATLFTNDTIYAFYEKLPFNKPSFGGAGPDYLAYTSAVP